VLLTGANETVEPAVDSVTSNPASDMAVAYICKVRQLILLWVVCWWTWNVVVVSLLYVSDKSGVYFIFMHFS